MGVMPGECGYPLPPRGGGMRHWGRGRGGRPPAPTADGKRCPRNPATPSTSWVVVIVNRWVGVARLTPASPPSMSRPSIPRRPSPWRCGAHGSSAHSGCKGDVSLAITCCGPDSQPWGEGVAAIGEDAGGADGAGPTAIPSSVPLLCRSRCPGRVPGRRRPASTPPKVGAHQGSGDAVVKGEGIVLSMEGGEGATPQRVSCGAPSPCSGPSAVGVGGWGRRRRRSRSPGGGC